jgi:hypothetical protein
MQEIHEEPQSGLPASLPKFETRASRIQVYSLPILVVLVARDLFDTGTTATDMIQLYYNNYIYQEF